MPPSRTAHARHGSRQPVQPQPTPPTGIAVPDIIILSSDDEDTAPRKPAVKKPPKPRPRGKPRPAPAAVAAPHEVVEIVSDDDPPAKNTERDLRAQLEKAKRVRRASACVFHRTYVVVGCIGN